MQMLCKNRVADFDTWWRVFRSHGDAHRAAGLDLVSLWHDADDHNEVFFLFEVEDRKRAQAFIDAPESADAGRESGVIEGAYHFVLPAEGYSD